MPPKLKRDAMGHFVPGDSADAKPAANPHTNPAAPKQASSLPATPTKSGSEQALLKSVQALENEFKREKNPEHLKELGQKIARLKEQLGQLTGPTYSKLQSENAELRKKLQQLEKRYAALSLSGKDAKPADAETQCRLYRLLLSKYADTINEKERKTVGEVKALINKDDLTVQSLANQFKGAGYAYEKNFHEAAQKAFSFIQSKIAYAYSDVNVNFWLTPTEILKEKVGDDEDLAVLLCSTLYALGDEKAEVVIAELDDLSTHAFVVTYYHDDFLLLDPCQDKPFEAFTGDKKDVLRDYRFWDSAIKRFLYKFNAKEYTQF